MLVRVTRRVGVVFGRDDDFGVTDQMACGVGEGGVMFAKHRPMPVCSLNKRLNRGRPLPTRAHVAQIDEGALLHLRRVKPGACDGNIAPAAGPRPGGRQRHAISAVGKQMRRRGNLCRVFEMPHHRRG